MKKNIRFRDHLWLWLCALSFAGYLLFSEAVDAFGAELSRLLAKL